MERHRLCYITHNYRGVNSSGNKAKTDNEDTLVAMGATNLGLRRTFYKNKILKFILDLAGIIHYCVCVREGDRIVLQYPIKKYFSFICNIAHLRGAKVITLIHDLGSMRRRKLTEQQEIRRLMHSDYVIASNNVMKQWLADHGYTNYLGALGLFDYRSNTSHKETEEKHNEPILVYAGALAMRKNAFLLQMPDVADGYKLHIYGNKSGLPEMKDSEHIIFHDFMPADKFIEDVVGDFGFVWDGDSLDSCTGDFGEYLRYNSPHKMSFYIRAGLPIIIWSDAAVAEIVRKEGIGICIDRIKELNSLSSLSNEYLKAMRENVRRISEKLASGGFLRTAVEESLIRLQE